MNASIVHVPASTSDDSSDVAVALEVAAALWEKGDSQEAIRWLKRAVDAARESGAASRAQTLAQAHAELETFLERPQHPPMAPEPEPALGLATPAAATAMAAESAAPIEILTPTGPPQAGLPEPTASGPLTSREDAGARSRVPGRDGRTRVSVKISARDPTLFLLRPLPEGQPLPPGTREGFLVLADGEPQARAQRGIGRKQEGEPQARAQRGIGRKEEEDAPDAPLGGARQTEAGPTKPNGEGAA